MDGHIGLVRHEYDGVAGVVEPREEAHDLHTGLRIEVAGRLVGQQDGWIVHEGARDGDPLSLTT
jgi:hypothetical protein